MGLLIPATLTTLVSCGNKDETKDEIYIKATKSTIDQSGDEADIGIFNKDGKQYHLTDLRDPVEWLIMTTPDTEGTETVDIALKSQPPGPAGYWYTITFSGFDVGDNGNKWEVFIGSFDDSINTSYNIHSFVFTCQIPMP